MTLSSPSIMGYHDYPWSHVWDRELAGFELWGREISGRCAVSIKYLFKDVRGHVFQDRYTGSRWFFTHGFAMVKVFGDVPRDAPKER